MNVGNAEIVSITSFSKPGSTSICICVAYVKVWQQKLINESIVNN